MKRVYSEPMVEKIAFNYRDQVVAASGEAAGNNGATGTGDRWNNNLLSGCVASGDIDDYIWSSSVFDICESWG